MGCFQLGFPVIGHLEDPDGDRGEGAGQGLAKDTIPGLGVGHQLVEPSTDWSKLRGGKIVILKFGFPDDENPGLPDSPLGEHGFQVGTHLFLWPCRDPDQHQGHGRAALPGLTQELPGHGVGISSGGGDEEPEIGCGQELGGQRPVCLGHGVDVR